MLPWAISQKYTESQEYGRDFHAVTCEERKGKVVENLWILVILVSRKIDLSSGCVPFGLCFLFPFRSVSAPSKSHFELTIVCNKYSENFLNPSVQDSFYFQTGCIFPL